MRISTKGRGIIKAQQGTVARPNPKENKDNPDRVNVQQQGFRGANVNMKDANGNYYIDPNRQLKGTDIQEMRTKGAKIPSGFNTLNDDAIDLLNGSLSGSTLIFFNNTTTDTTMGISITNTYGQSTSATPDIPASSMVVYPIAGVIRNVALFGNSVIGSNTYVALILNNVKNMNYYSGHETDRLIIGTNQNLPVQGLLAVMCINNT